MGFDIQERSPDMLKSVSFISPDNSLPAGYRIEWTGVACREQQAGQTAAFAHATALVFSYLLLVAQYHSWSIPAAIIAGRKLPKQQAGG